MLRSVRPQLQLAKKNVTMYAEAAKRTPGAGVRVISERDQQVMAVLARDSIALTLESQHIGIDSWLANTLRDVSQSHNEFTFGEGFTNSLDLLDSAAESAIPPLQERITEPDPSIDEVVEEMSPRHPRQRERRGHGVTVRQVLASEGSVACLQYLGRRLHG